MSERPPYEGEQRQEHCDGSVTVWVPDWHAEWEWDEGASWLEWTDHAAPTKGVHLRPRFVGGIRYRCDECSAEWDDVIGASLKAAYPSGSWEAFVNKASAFVAHLKARA